MAGYQDGALYAKGQRLSIPALLAEQFKQVGGSAFNQALMPDDNKGLGLGPTPWSPPFFTAFHLGNKTDCQHVTSLNPLNSVVSVSAVVEPAQTAPEPVILPGTGIELTVTTTKDAAVPQVLVTA